MSEAARLAAPRAILAAAQSAAVGNVPLAIPQQPRPMAAQVLTLGLLEPIVLLMFQMPEALF